MMRRRKALGHAGSARRSGRAGKALCGVGFRQAFPFISVWFFRCGWCLYGPRLHFRFGPWSAPRGADGFAPCERESHQGPHPQRLSPSREMSVPSSRKTSSPPEAGRSGEPGNRLLTKGEGRAGPHTLAAFPFDLRLRPAGERARDIEWARPGAARRTLPPIPASLLPPGGSGRRKTAGGPSSSFGAGRESLIFRFIFAFSPFLLS